MLRSYGLLQLLITGQVGQLGWLIPMSLCAHCPFILALIHSTFCSRTDRYDLARKTFQDMSTKKLDYPEALWDAWHNFEHVHGDLDSIEEALNKINQAKAQTEMRRRRVCTFPLISENYSTAV